MDARAWTVIPSLSSSNRLFSRRTTRLPIVVSVLAALAVLPCAYVFMAPTPMAASGRSPVTVAAPTPLPAPKAGKATIVASNAPTCHAVMQRLPGSLAATSSTADKPGIVMIDVNKAGVMMACSYSDLIAISVSGDKPG